MLMDTIDELRKLVGTFVEAGEHEAARITQDRVKELEALNKKAVDNWFNQRS